MNAGPLWAIKAVYGSSCISGISNSAQIARLGPCHLARSVTKAFFKKSLTSSGFTSTPASPMSIFMASHQTMLRSTSSSLSMDTSVIASSCTVDG